MTLTTSLWIGAPKHLPSAQTKPDNASALTTSADEQIVNQLVDLERRVKQIAESTHPAVVAIDQGSGVIINDDGIVLTVSHVAPKIGRRVSVRLSNGRSVAAVTLGSDSATDIAALQLLEPGPWPAVRLGDSQKIQQGDRCVSLGYPKTFKHGQPSSIRLGRVQNLTDQKITTTCFLMGGDSGGALFDTDGRLIAINQKVKKDANQNLHIPINVYFEHWESLISGKDFPKKHASQKPRVYLGISGETDVEKVRITRVHANSPAAKAGLAIEDVITHVNGQTVTSFSSVLNILNSPTVSNPVSIAVNRYGTLKTVLVELDLNRQFVSPTVNSNRQPNQANLSPGNDRSTTQSDATENFRALSPTIASSLKPMVAQYAQSIIEFKSPHGRRSLGTVVSRDGLVVAKNSELVDSFACFVDGKTVAASLIGSDDRLDLALVKLESSELSPISFPRSPVTFEPGTMVLSIGTTNTPVAMGVLSARRQQFDIPVFEPPSYKFGARFRNQMMVLPQRDPGSVQQSGLEVTRVTPRTLAEQTGLLVGDLIESFNGKTIESPVGFKNQIEKLCIGQTIEVKIWRDHKPILLQTQINTFGQKSIFDQWGGGPFSQRRFGFGQVLPHDSRLRPDDCGGLLVDLNGKVVGLNIARSLRVATFALSMDDIKNFVLKLQPNAALQYER